MTDGWSCVRYSDGPLDYFFVEFHINGVLPEDGYKFTFAKDGMSVKFKCAIRKECYGKCHLAAFINDYSDSHSLVTAVDRVDIIGVQSKLSILRRDAQALQSMGTWNTLLE